MRASAGRVSISPCARRENFAPEFSGTGAEYFRVWIVNIALTIVTIGIYSAWAKVRNKQYFYGHTRLAGSSFEYTANPLNILKGRLLVFGALIAYQLAWTFHQPVFAVVIAVLLVPVLPWVVIKAVSFNLRYSAYRGLRLHFDGQYAEAFRVYLLWTLAVIASFGLLYPYVAWRRKTFLVERARYGRSSFGFTGEVGWFYVVYIIAGIAYVGMILGIIVLMTGAITVGAALGGELGSDLAGAEASDLDDMGKGLVLGFGVVMYGAFALFFVALNTGVQAMIANHVWQHTHIADVRFDLRLNLWRTIWIQISNIFAIIFSVGLLIPWAKVRMIRYKLSCFGMSAVASDLDYFLASARDRVEATGAELGDALDLDLGL